MEEVGVRVYPRTSSTVGYVQLHLSSTSGVLRGFFVGTSWVLRGDLGVLRGDLGVLRGGYVSCGFQKKLWFRCHRRAAKRQLCAAIVDRVMIA